VATVAVASEILSVDQMVKIIAAPQKTVKKNFNFNSSAVRVSQTSAASIVNWLIIQLIHAADRPQLLNGR
jgi:hypothetical protein